MRLVHRIRKCAEHIAGNAQPSTMNNLARKYLSDQLAMSLLHVSLHQQTQTQLIKFEGRHARRP